MVETSSTPRVGVVVIGRNEGERLRRSLSSVVGAVRWTVYVDSASTDGSVACARALGAEVVELDARETLCAARARNRGAARLLELDPELEWIQFLDGDCELVPGWLERAAQEFAHDSRLAVVCGRRRERSREASAYHRLYDIEWDAPVGDDQACGGDALMRVTALRAVGGFREALIAGEEPELCVRLRAAGWRVRRIAAEMSVHDAGPTSCVRWWRRARRAGYAYAAGASLHGASPARHWVRERRSIWFWGLLLPLLVAATAPLTEGRSLALLLAYPSLWLRIAWRHQRRGLSRADAALFATACVVGKFPEVLGQLSFQRERWSQRHRTLAGAVGESRVPG